MTHQGMQQVSHSSFSTSAAISAMPSVESDNTSLLFMIFASLVCSIPTPLRIRSIGVDLCSLDGLVSVGSSSKLFYFHKYFFEELEGRK